MTELKDLPKDEQGNYLRKFTANGIEYTIRNISDVMSPARYIEFTRFTAIFGFGVDYESLVNHLNDAQKLMLDIHKDNSLTKIEPLMKIEAIKKSILEMSQTKFDASMYLCSIFITEPNEDIRKWDFDDATKKIESWNTEGYAQQSFFRLAIFSVPKFLDDYRDMAEKERMDNINILNGLTD